MKLKFRADSKDITIFCSFAGVLLYLIAIALLNIIEFIETSTLWGFNPIPAFTEYFFPTMVFYLIALIMSIASVSSYFFDREKGIGIQSGKKEKGGYSRWAKEKELQSQLKKITPGMDTIPYAGVPIINNGKEVWVDDGEYHNLIIGATGSGKTQIIVNPLVKLLAKKGESMIITDPKGEIYEENCNLLRQKGYNIVLLNFREPIKGNAWNPLTLPYNLYKEGNQDKAIELIDDLAANILYDESSKSQDPFWERTSADYFAGLSLALFEDAPEEEINLNSINLMTNIGEEKIGASNYMKEYFSDKDPSGPAYTNASGTLIAPSETKGSILSVFKQKIKLFASRANLSEMLSHSDFDIKDIGRQKTAVFIVVQDEKKTYHSLVTIFIKQAYETLIDVAQENGGQLPYRTNFILDEFANMPPLKDVTTMITASRSRKMRFNFIIQNFAQLYQVYGKENGETIKGNCGNLIYLISSELSALEEISKMCGEVKSKEKDKTVSTPLVTVSDLQRLKQWETIVVRSRTMPFKTKLTPNYKMIQQGLWGQEYPKADYPMREKKQVQVFDIKKYVDDKRQKKMDEMFGPSSGATGGSSRSMPNPGIFGAAPAMPNRDMSNLMGNAPKTPPTGNMNVDSLLKRIDEKIAELEEEERLEKEKMEQKNTPVKGHSSTIHEDKEEIDEPISTPIEPIHKIIPKEPVVPIKVVEENVKKEEKVVELKPELEEKPVLKPILKPIPKPVEKVLENVVPEPKVGKPKKQEPLPHHKETIFSTPIIDDDEELPAFESTHNVNHEPIPTKTVEKPVVEVKKSVVVEPTITDDQFFDDFFNDDEE